MELIPPMEPTVQMVATAPMAPNPTLLLPPMVQMALTAQLIPLSQRTPQTPPTLPLASL